MFHLLKRGERSIKKKLFLRSPLFKKFFSPKGEMLVESRNLGRKSKFWSKVEILVKKKVLNQKNFFFHCKIFFQPKFRLLTNFFCCFFRQKAECWSKVEMLVESRNVGRKPKFWSQVEIFVESRNFGQKSKFW